MSETSATVTAIDLNSDVGESFGNWSFGDDATIVTAATSVNVACGFHAGDPSSMHQTCLLAARAGVVVGAHPGYRDLVGFGRRFIDVAPDELTDEVIYQIGALQALAAAAGTTVSYVKPHGALYNAIVHHTEHARAVARAVASVDPSLPLLVLPHSQIQSAADAAGLRTVLEAFADRAYNPDGTLVSRRERGAVLTDVDEVTDRVVRMATEGTVLAVDGTVIDIEARSICVHGDTPGAATMAAAVRRALDRSGVRVESFV